MPEISTNGYGVLQVWCEACEDWMEFREMQCSCGAGIDTAGGNWKCDGNGHLWLFCEVCGDWDAVDADGIDCPNCGTIVY